MQLEQSPIPLYFQVKNIIKSKITSNELKGQERIPSEAELCAEYGVSRATVRQALSELMTEGLIYRVRGKGTFVTDSAGLKQLSLKGTIENLIASWKGTWSKILEYKEIPPPSRIATVLQLEKHEKVYLLELVRNIPEGVFGYCFIYLPPHLGKSINREELDETIEVITFLESKLNCFVHRASQVIDVALATGAVAKNLQIKANSPVLFIERDYYARNGESLFATLNYFRPDLYKYRIELTRT